MIEITTIYFVWLLRIFQPYLILSIENLLSTKPLLNLPVVNRYTPFGVIIDINLRDPQNGTNIIKDIYFLKKYDGFSLDCLINEKSMHL